MSKYVKIIMGDIMTVAFKVDEQTKQKMIDYYFNKKRDKTPPYAIFQADEEDTVVTLYESGKVVFQGTSADIDASMWQTNSEHFTEDIQKDDDDITTNFINTIGSDEVGTGDFFGPIVVTACFVDKKNIMFLENLRIQDSKKYNDQMILELVPKFIDKVTYESIVLNNKDYNSNYSNNLNMNRIKAILHNKVLYKLTQREKDYDLIVVDQFTPKDKFYEYLKDNTNIVRNITFFTKAEDKVLSVACASMISRYLFVKEFIKLSKELGKTIPKGAGPIVDLFGKEIVEKYGIEKLNDIAKMNFKNVEKIKALL